jgi:uncharacterized protein (TIGR03435 family)
MHAYGTTHGYDLEWKSPWMGTEFYDVAAKVPAGATKEQFGVMLQRLLDQRFGLVVHRETRQLPGYRLVVAEKGTKLRKSREAPPVSSQPSIVVKNGIPEFSENAPSGVSLTLTRAMIRGRHETMMGLVRQLVQRLGSPVIDATGLEGEYDYDLSFAPEPRPVNGSNTMVMFPPGAVAAAPQQGNPADPDGQPTLRTALQQQLGLKLEAVNSVPTEVVVLDKANREPTVN